MYLTMIYLIDNICNVDDRIDVDNVNNYICVIKSIEYNNCERVCVCVFLAVPFHCTTGFTTTKIFKEIAGCICKRLHFAELSDSRPTKNRNRFRLQNNHTATQFIQHHTVGHIFEYVMFL